MDDFYTLSPPEKVSPDDVIAHGARWRAQRDELADVIPLSRSSSRDKRSSTEENNDA